ncbi:microtubule-severing ATPase [Paenibacillus baekrokdamisoli]|uniref:Microtubule-severing ATPase n=1 Tax=Paenibacillus baekrokdamisoli TaxID=1712516 RepID=A0A3G9IPZ8_9BACL|nr:AAA family ATPase [Paenibacillus baekrokdamisoli]MBB3069699.1 ATP-dependent metalloprotease FtsH [Paenibacillus baekrokdamisoli]BBH20947.1 microtubule-severing ATPase [Paenibacillus baekrokdamisoli]
MRNYSKEIMIGFMPIFILFMQFFVGVNMIPIVLFAGLAGGLLYVAKSRGNLAAIGGERKGKPRLTTPLSFEEIGGQERAKQEIIEALDFLVNVEQISKLGIRPLKGILLTGPPGTGKTLLAKAAAHYTDSIYVAASGSEFVEMYVGVGASRIRDMFKEARQKALKAGKNSAVIFIDEIDVIGGKRDGGQHREYDQTLNQLLTEMDGIHTSESPRILLIGATNRKEMLDSALLRPGRFDRHIAVDLPDKKGRAHILHIHARNKPLHEEVSLEKIAEESFGFSGAQLESVMNESAIYALRDSNDSITQRHLSLAIDKVLMGEQSDREATKEERERVALHELGHAIAAELVRPGSVSQVALQPRGQALGYVRHNPQQDRYLYTREFLDGQIMIALGGAAAEEIFYGDRSTGSRGDFEQSMSIVRTMVESGLTDLGIIDSSMMTPDKWAGVNHTILEELMGKVKQMLGEHKEVFLRSLDVLIAEETLGGDRFRSLLGDTAARPNFELQTV